MATKRYEVHIQRATPAEENKLIIVQSPATRLLLHEDPDSLQLSVMPKSFKMKLERKNKDYKTTNVYTTSRNNVDDSQLFVCKLVNDRLVCQPLSQIVTMRSDFSHMNPKEEVDPREEVRPVSVKFSANDRHHAPGKVNDNRIDPNEMLETYQEYIFRQSNGKYANVQRELLFGRQTKIKPDPDAEPLDIKPNINLIPDVKPKIEKMDVDDIYSLDMKTSNIQITQKNTELLKQRVKECLLKAKIVSFEELYHFLRDYRELRNSTSTILEFGPKEINDILNEYAVLVQGNWAIKSEILYGDSGDRECTDVTGIPIDLFTAARDYLLWLFDQKPVVSRLAYSRNVKIPDHDVLELFNQLAYYRPDIKRWELKLKPDKKYLERNQDIVARQKAVWRVRKNNKLSIFQ